MGHPLKTMLRRKLVEIIRAVCAGNKCVPQEVALEIAKHLGVEDLSAREVEVLRTLPPAVRVNLWPTGFQRPRMAMTVFRARR